VVESYVTALELDAQPVRLLGVDPFAEPPFRSYLGSGAHLVGADNSLAKLLVEPNTVLLSEAVAKRHNIGVGQVLHVRAGTRQAPLTVLGLLRPSDDFSRRALDGLLIADIATAQEVLGKVGRLDRIDLIVPEGAPGDAVLAQIRAILPPGAQVERPEARTGTVEEMTAAFRLNLSALSLLALVVGMFLVYNTVTFSVVQRRPVLGAFRALGMTRQEIFGLILLESGVLGLIGAILGLGLGVLLGRGAVQLVTQTVNDLFFVVAVREVEIPATTLLKGFVSGLGTAILAAVVPAYEATSVPPAGALQRSEVEARVRRLLPWVTGGGVAMLAMGAALLIPEWNLVITFAGLFAIIIGVALITPSLVLLGMTGVQRAVGLRSSILMRMAPRNIIRSLSRTSIAIAALMVSVSVIIGVGIMIGSFRLTVEQWLNDVLQADIYVSPVATGADRAFASLEPMLAQELGHSPGISRWATSREVTVAARVAVNPSKNTTPASEQNIRIKIVALSDDLAGADRRYKASLGDWRTTWQGVRDGGVVVNEPMANRYGIGVGDRVFMLTDQGEKDFPVVGVAYDFDVMPGVLMDDAVYRRFWDDDAISAVALFVAPGVNVDEKVAELRSAFAGKAELIIRSNRGTRQNALEVFDRTFAITVALQLLATLVAFIGILSTLLSLQLERRREIGVLRSTGMTRRQVWLLTFMETGLVGSSAGLIAIPTGLILAVILIYIINLRSFGWTLQMQLQAKEFVQAFLVALIAALLAGIYPAWRMGETQPADAVRME
jgi:putative ABC transport system permease protein